MKAAVRWSVAPIEPAVASQMVLSPDRRRLAVFVVVRHWNRAARFCAAVRDPIPGYVEPDYPDPLGVNNVEQLVEVRDVRSGRVLWQHREVQRWWLLRHCFLNADSENVYWTVDNVTRAWRWETGAARWAHATAKPSWVQIVEPFVVIRNADVLEVFTQDGRRWAGDPNRLAARGSYWPLDSGRGHYAMSPSIDASHFSPSQPASDPEVAHRARNHLAGTRLMWLTGYDGRMDRWYAATLDEDGSFVVHAFNRAGRCRWERADAVEPQPCGELVVVRSREPPFKCPRAIALDAATGRPRWAIPQPADARFNITPGTGWIFIDSEPAEYGYPIREMSPLWNRRALRMRDGTEIWRTEAIWEEVELRMEPAGRGFVRFDPGGPVTLLYAEHPPE